MLCSRENKFWNLSVVNPLFFIRNFRVSYLPGCQVLNKISCALQQKALIWQGWNDPFFFIKKIAFLRIPFFAFHPKVNSAFQVLVLCSRENKFWNLSVVNPLFFIRNFRVSYLPGCQVLNKISCALRQKALIWQGWNDPFFFIKNIEFLRIPFFAFHLKVNFEV